MTTMHYIETTAELSKFRIMIGDEEGRLVKVRRKDCHGFRQESPEETYSPPHIIGIGKNKMKRLNNQTQDLEVLKNCKPCDGGY